MSEHDFRRYRNSYLEDQKSTGLRRYMRLKAAINDGTPWMEKIDMLYNVFKCEILFSIILHHES